MTIHPSTIPSFLSELDSILSPEISSLLSEIKDSTAYVSLPSSDDVDLPPDFVARLVASTSNQYAKACRLGGLARAEFKLAEGAFKLKFKASFGPGKNAEEREAKAMIAAEEEYTKMILLSAIVALVESVETASRIASESSRRMLLGAEQQTKAEARSMAYTPENSW